MVVTLSEDQEAAIEAVLAWYRSGATPYMTLGGLAGTGKTTIIKKIVELLVDVSVCAFTGKAAYVLRTKGVPATTIHKLIYLPYEICLRSGLDVLDCKMCLVDGKSRCKDVETEFRLAPELATPLIIVDEASMVSTPLFVDLCSFGIPILFVGDHGQLEPVGDNPQLMRAPNIRLEKIHRQAESSPILRFAHAVRLGAPPVTMGPEARVIYTPTAPRDLERFDMVLAGKNDTRVALNKRLRRGLGFEDPRPQVSERVICLRNDDKRNIFNGLLATVKSFQESQDGDGMRMSVEDDLGQLYPDLPVAIEQFNCPQTLTKIPRRKTLWDFGYCLTVHKSQGSEWGRVCVCEWVHPEASAERWRYTAATRAVDELLYCINPRRR